MSSKPETVKEQEKLNRALKENILLKSRISFVLGSLETVNFLLKNENPEILKKNLDHLRQTIGRVLDDLRKEM